MVSVVTQGDLSFASDLEFLLVRMKPTGIFLLVVSKVKVDPWHKHSFLSFFLEQLLMSLSLKGAQMIFYTYIKTQLDQLCN